MSSSSVSASTSSVESTRQHERYQERALSRDEPSQTKTLRATYASRLRGRWRAIRAAIRESIVEHDALRLQAEALIDAPTEYAFTSDTDRVPAFNNWLSQTTDREILTAFGKENEYITRAYESGVDDARSELRVLGVSQEAASAGATAVQLPIHQEQLSRLYSRNFNELEGMTDAISTELRRELSMGLASGEGPREIAEERLSEVIGQVEDGTPRGAMNRATRIARTEVMNSHNWARAQEWERAGIKKVDILVASTACERCLALQAGAPYEISEARGLLPGSTHPNCRCALTIYTES